MEAQEASTNDKDIERDQEPSTHKSPEEDAERLAAELDAARAMITELERRVESSQETRYYLTLSAENTCDHWKSGNSATDP